MVETFRWNVCTGTSVLERLYSVPGDGRDVPAKRLYKAVENFQKTVENSAKLWKTKQNC